MTHLLSIEQSGELIAHGRLIPMYGVPIISEPVHFVRYVTPKTNGIAYAIASEEDLIRVGVLPSIPTCAGATAGVSSDATNGGLTTKTLQPADFSSESIERFLLSRGWEQNNAGWRWGTVINPCSREAAFKLAVHQCNEAL